MDTDNIRRGWIAEHCLIEPASEEDLAQILIEEWYPRFRVQVMRIPDSRLVTLPGWPDDIIIGPRGILCRELKATYGVVSKDQDAIGLACIYAGWDWAVWRPRDLATGRIWRELGKIA
jgi:hypothetical protein